MSHRKSNSPETMFNDTATCHVGPDLHGASEPGRHERQGESQVRPYRIDIRFKSRKAYCNKDSGKADDVQSKPC